MPASPGPTSMGRQARSRIRLPWPAYAVSIKDRLDGTAVGYRLEDDDIVFESAKNKVYRLEPIIRKW